MEIEPRVTRDIYGMPAFLSLTVADVEASVDWYVNGLDFVSLFTLPGPDSAPALVHLRRWRYQDILVRPGRSQAGTGLTFSVLAEHGQLDQLAERARRHGGGTVEGPLTRRGTPAICVPSTRTASRSSSPRAGRPTSETSGSAARSSGCRESSWVEPPGRRQVSALPARQSAQLMFQSPNPSVDARGTPVPETSTTSPRPKFS